MTRSVSVLEVIRTEWMRRWRPEIVVDGDSLKCAVRWLHVVETLDAAAMVRVGDVALSTGSMLAEGGTIARRLACSLAENGALALILAKGPALEEASRALAGECRLRGLALVTVHHSVCLADLTERAQLLLASQQGDDLALSEELRTRFGQALHRRASIGELLAVAAEYSGCPVVLESAARRPIAAESGPLRPAEALRFWHRCRGVSPQPGAGTAGAPPDWIVADLGSQAQLWGRLVLCGYLGPRRRGVLLAERTSEALSMHRMLEHSCTPASDEHCAELLDSLLEGRLEADEAAIRLRLAGLQPTDAILAVAVRTGADQADFVRGESVAALASRLARELDLRILALADRGSMASALVALPSNQNVSELRRRIDEWLRMSDPVPLSVGLCDRVVDPAELGSVIREAELVAEAAAGLSPAASRRLDDVRLRTLLTELAPAVALHRFIGAMLGRLTTDSSDIQLKELLWTYLSMDANKTFTAQRHHLSRPALYRRLRRIEDLLGVDFSDAEDRASVYVALLADRLTAATSHPAEQAWRPARAPRSRCGSVRSTPLGNGFAQPLTE